MARPREYDRSDVLEKAVGVFWQKGFKACSVADIVEATGLNTASMYKEFGDKEGLFREALEHYRVHIVSDRFRILIDSPNLSGVKDYVQAIVDGACLPGYRGCLMMNSLAQRDSISPETAAMVSAFCEHVEGLVEAALHNARAQGEISADKDPVELASFILCCVHGLVLYGRHPNKKRDVARIHRVILRALEG